MNTIQQQKVLKYVNEYLEKGKLMQLATVKDKQPWIINCWYTYDANLNFYFISGQTARHIKELKNNEKVACSITPHYTLEKLGQKVQGLMFEGIAEEVSGFSLTEVFNNFIAKWKLATKHINLDRIKKGGAGSKLYKIKATKIVWFDEINFPDNPRQEINLKNEIHP
ncbi:MAG: pyridoxamine 5'-phosphate oxidase family protein [Candidatus Magasanikbacteria bacterium]|nr:pyridoxamine 5'-phosphate oxidase family protein [Candidatus Magasanikbacteria bacterium]